LKALIKKKNNLPTNSYDAIVKNHTKAMHPAIPAMVLMIAEQQIKHFGNDNKM
jgi:hypothetical protein